MKANGTEREGCAEVEIGGEAGRKGSVGLRVGEKREKEEEKG